MPEYLTLVCGFSTMGTVSCGNRKIRKGSLYSEPFHSGTILLCLFCQDAFTRMEDVEVEPSDDVAQGSLGLDRVAGVIQRGCEGRYAHHARNDAHDAAAHAGLGRKARVEEPVARMLVKPTVAIIEAMRVPRSGLKTVCLVTGFTPSNAMVAAATASWRAVTPIEHWRV